MISNLNKSTFPGTALPVGDSLVTTTAGSPVIATYTSGGVNYKTYSFTGSGSITLSKGGLVDVFLVGGGGGMGGGGGGIITSQIYLPSGTTTVTVGAGGGGAGAIGTGGGISAIGYTTRSYIIGIMGGGGGTRPGASPGQGNNLAPWDSNIGFASGSENINGYGGPGGAGGAGGNATAPNGTNPPWTGGAGGIGIYSDFRTGSNIGYSGGGGGCGYTYGGAGATVFGGANGTSGQNGPTAASGTANTGGGGGGGGWNYNGGNGGSGIVVIRVRV